MWETRKGASLLLRKTDIQIVSSIVAGDAETMQSTITRLLSNLRAQETSLHAETASKASFKKAEVETALSKFHTAEPSNPTPKRTRSSSFIVAVTLMPTITSTPTVLGGVPLNSTALERTNNSTISAPGVITNISPHDIISTAASDSATQNVTVASSTLTSSSTHNVGVVQPTGTLKAAGALALGVAGVMILL